jgi:hypothetical protein
VNARRAKRQRRLVRKAAREARWALYREHPELSIASSADVLKRLYPQASIYDIAYHGPRVLGGRFKRRYGGPEFRVRQYGPHPFLAILGPIEEALDG